VFRKRKSRLKRFEELFPESLEFVARSMARRTRVLGVARNDSREFQEPLAGEFRRTFEEHNLGLPLEVALQKLASAYLLDVHFFVPRFCCKSGPVAIWPRSSTSWPT